MNRSMELGEKIQYPSKVKNNEYQGGVNTDYSLDSEQKTSLDGDDQNIFLTPSPSYEEISKIRKILFVLMMALTQLLCQAYLAQTIIPYHYIATDFDINDKPGEISWMTAAYSLTVGTFIMMSGRLGDVLGYKKVYLCSYINLSVWSILGGISYYSGSIIFFDICRAMQGLSFSASLPNSLGLLGHYFPDGGRKHMVFAVFGSVAPAGFVCGALMSSLFAQLVNWRWFFYISGIISSVVTLAAWYIIPDGIGSIRQKSLKVFDVWGSIFGVSGLILVNFAFNQGPVVGWERPYVYTLLIIGVILVFSFFLIEAKVSFALVPKLDTKIHFTLGIIALGWSSFGIWLFYTAKFALDILKLPAIVTAVQFIPCMFAGIVAAMGTGFLISRMPTSLIMLFSMFCFEGTLLLNGLRPTEQTYWAQKFPGLIIAAFGMDTSYPAGTMILSSELPREHQGLAASLIATVVNYSISIGLGVAGTVEYYTTKHGATELQGIRNAFYTGMGLSGLAVVVATIFNILTFYNYRKKNPINPMRLTNAFL